MTVRPLSPPGATASVHRLVYDDVLRMVDAGIIAENARVELIDGVLVDLHPIGAYHDGTLAWLNKRFVRAVGDEHEVRIQSLFHLSRGDFVLPDLMVVDASLGVARQPATAALVIEVAQSSQAHDRAKAFLYAAAGVQEYWIADVVAQTVTIHRDPAAGGYARVTEHRTGTLVPSFGAPEIPVAELVGPTA